MNDSDADAVFWEHVALSRKRAWLMPDRRLSWRIEIGSDEYWRYTLCVGPLVIALWMMPGGRDRLRELEARMDEIYR